MAQVSNKIVVASEFFDPNENSTGFLVHELYVTLKDDCIVQRAMPAKFLSNWKPQKRGPKLLKKALILIDVIFKTRRLSDRGSVLLIVSNPFFNWFLTRVVGDFKAIHFLAFDVFPETGGAFLSNRIVNALKKLRSWSLAHKLKFICIGRDMADYISREYPDNQIRNVGIWVDPIKVVNREKHFDVPILLFFGNFGELTDFFAIKKLCAASKRDYEIKVVGNGSEKFSDHLDSIPLVALSKAVRFEKRSEVYNNITASLVVQHPRLKGLAVPSKAFFSWENHVPIIYFGARDSELFRLIDEHPFLGYAFEYQKLDSSETCEKVNSIMINLLKVRSDPRIGEWLAENRKRSLASIKSFLSEDNSQKVNCIMKKTPNKKCLHITPTRHGDHRGFFGETYSRRRYAEMEIDVEFVQDNHSLSYAVGTLRGLHFQAPPAAQGKLVRCGRGAIFDVAVDIRRGSPTYGQWEGYALTAENGHQLYLPVGFAHGFVTLEPDSEIVYKCTDYYAPETEGAVRWDSCGIDWPLSVDLILSDKDAIAPALADFVSPFIYGENS